MGVPFHGRNGLIYISGDEVIGANSWRINITQDAVETPQFTDVWKKRAIGMNDWSGNITAWMHMDSKLIVEAAVAQAAVPVMIYPLRTDLSSYFQGDVIFGANTGGSTTTAVDNVGDFVAYGDLSIVGFA